MTEPASHPELADFADIDRLVHEPARLMLMAVLYVIDSADFTFLMNQTGMTWGNLSAHMSKLEEAGYLDCREILQRQAPQHHAAPHPPGSRCLPGLPPDHEAGARWPARIKIFHHPQNPSPKFPLLEFGGGWEGARGQSFRRAPHHPRLHPDDLLFLAHLKTKPLVQRHVAWRCRFQVAAYPPRVRPPRQLLQQP